MHLRRCGHLHRHLELSRTPVWHLQSLGGRRDVCHASLGQKRWLLKLPCGKGLWKQRM